MKYKVLVSEEVKRQLPPNVDLMRLERDIVAHLETGIPMLEAVSKARLYLPFTQQGYGITIIDNRQDNRKYTHIDNRKYEFHKCSISLENLQDELRNIAVSLRNADDNESASIIAAIDTHIETIEEVREIVQESGDTNPEDEITKRRSLKKGLGSLYNWIKDEAPDVLKDLGKIGTGGVKVASSQF